LAFDVFVLIVDTALETSDNIDDFAAPTSDSIVDTAVDISVYKLGCNTVNNLVSTYDSSPDTSLDNDDWVDDIWVLTVVTAAPTSDSIDVTAAPTSEYKLVCIFWISLYNGSYISSSVFDNILDFAFPISNFKSVSRSLSNSNTYTLIFETSSWSVLTKPPVLNISSSIDDLAADISEVMLVVALEISDNIVVLADPTSDLIFVVAVEIYVFRSSSVVLTSDLTLFVAVVNIESTYVSDDVTFVVIVDFADPTSVIMDVVSPLIYVSSIFLSESILVWRYVSITPISVFI